MSITADNGYFFGLGVFETIDIIHGHCVLLEKHIERLNRSCKFFKLKNPITEGTIQDYLAKQGLINYSGAMKITVSSENTLFTVRDNPYPPEKYQEGFALTYTQVRRNETSPFTYHKTLNQGDNLQEREAAQAKGFDEVIFLNTVGEITEGSLTNIFFVKNGGLFTPPIGSGLINGTIRQYLLETQEVTEVALTPGSVRKFDECFVTNSLMGIMPVRSLGDKTFNGFSKTRELKRKYDAVKHEL
ncbi:MAG: aminotransferase class IV [Bacillota bacterium]|nr:aminotransferase class IV [Bacillota bacterium]